MKDKTSTTPPPDRLALRQLMAAYFHQGWGREYGTSWEAAVDDFARREPDRVRPAISQIEDLLAGQQSDDGLALALDDLENYRHTGDEPDAYATWLRDVVARLRAPGA